MALNGTTMGQQIRTAISAYVQPILDNGGTLDPNDLWEAIGGAIAEHISDNAVTLHNISTTVTVSGQSVTAHIEGFPVVNTSNGTVVGHVSGSNIVDSNGAIIGTVPFGGVIE